MLINQYNFIIFYFLGWALIVVTLFHMLYRRRSSTSMISWLLAMLLVPYVFVVLYFLIGTRKRHNKKQKPHVKLQSYQQQQSTYNGIESVLVSQGIPVTTYNNILICHHSGVQAFDALLMHIRAAKTSISLCTYVFKIDETTRQILNELVVKAHAGIKVRLLIDALGSYALYFCQRSLASLRQAGGEVYFFMPILRIPIRNYINLRNHRKIYLFDNQQVFTGGMNLTNEYMGHVNVDQQWKDLLFFIKGPAVFHYAQVFESDWAYACGDLIKEASIPIPSASNISLQVVPSGPDIGSDALFESLLYAIYKAKQRIWIVTPYFVPDNNLMQALIIACHRGVDVKLITPKRSNHKIADLGRSSYMRELEEKGLDLLLYYDSMLHAKAVLFDDDMVMIGSVNFGNRSLFLNYEIVSFAYSKQVNQQMEQWMRELMLHTKRGIRPAGSVRRIMENLMRIIAPQL